MIQTLKNTLTSEQSNQHVKYAHSKNQWNYNSSESFFGFIIDIKNKKKFNITLIKLTQIEQI